MINLKLRGSAKMLLIFWCMFSAIVNGYAQYEDSYTAQTFLQFTTNGSNTADIILRNGIQRELIYEYTISSNSKIDSTLVAVVFYDETGNIFEKWKGLNKDKVVEKYSYGVDSLNRPAMLKISSNDPASDLAALEVEYDTLGREVNMYQYNIDTTYLVIRHKEYNERGLLAGLYTKINNDSFYQSHQYLNHVNGQLLAMHVMAKNRSLIYTYRFQYDTARRSRTVTLIWDDASQEIGQFVYDGTNRLVKVTAPQPLGELHTFYIYNPDGTLFESHKRKRERGGKVSSLTRHYYTKGL